ncbi:RNA polymerase sigma factor [Micromonospora aurantiaca (nom. illeg.)]|uniref:RNA polymerase sigma factor n=1 Tax=Micromonospora aurantiaca (nom. illeg.) TaxID=47850 RepID=UPI001656B8DB|nr:sigma-70 family RNA polymerase sigma factor [Micromonospora aurantiaca]MBC9006157.1 sigma-70 family RNA polymerase sigma factor [Micromonospora aurantiaca]
MAAAPRFIRDSAAAADDLLKVAAATRQEPPAPAGQMAAATTEHQTADHGFAEFFAAEFPSLVSFLLLQGASLEEAEDAVQEAMLLTLPHWNTINSPRAYVRVAAMRRLQRQRQMLRNRARPFAEVPEPSQMRNPHEIEAASEKQHVLAVLGRLPQRQRQVIALTIDGYSPAEIAEMLHVDPVSVRSSLRHARQSLRTALHVEEPPMP